MTVAGSCSRWLAGAALLAACSAAPTSSTSAPQATSSSAPSTSTAPATSGPASTSTSFPLASASVTTLLPIDPSVLIPIYLGSKPLPGPGDELAAQYHGYAGDPNAILQVWMVTPMAVPAGPDVRLLGFERAVGISSTSATFLTGAIDPDAALSTIATVLAPSPTYTVTTSTRTEGTVTIHALDAQPNTVQGDPPGWTVEASVVDRLGIVHITRRDYSFEDAVPTFADLPAGIQDAVANDDAIAVTAGGVLSAISYEYGVGSLGDAPAHRTRLTYDIKDDFVAATDKVTALLTVGWQKNEQTDAVYFTSATTTEVWTLDDFGGATHLTYDTGS